MQLIAYDGNAKRVFIDNALRGKKYYCPICREELIPVFGEIKNHHFRHYPHCECSDSWTKDKVYDLDVKTYSWHKEWADNFSEINREVALKFDNITHRADVLVGDTVLELQHSPLKSRIFDMRTNFYLNCDCRVIWLFDYRNYFRDGIVTVNGDYLQIKHTIKTFDNLTTVDKNLQLFIQLYDDDSQHLSIVKIKTIGKKYLDGLTIAKWLTKEEFLSEVGKNNDICPPPNIKKINKDPIYQELANKYNLSLNDQQIRAVQNIDGSNLMLSVPGSGKTETLVAKLGYMVLGRAIPPQNILVLSYTKTDSLNLKERIKIKYGCNEKMDQIKIQTINSLGEEIYRKNYPNKKLITESTKKVILTKLWKKYNFQEYFSESDYLDISTTISLVKNTMINDINNFKCDIKKFNNIYNDYCNELGRNNLYDFDDQLVCSYELLSNKQELLEEYRNKYRYVLVDEAQDNTKIQFEIIKLIFSKTNNVFMVGDEDQSVYAFRGACPQELFEFKDRYSNASVLKLETNYRSYSEITDLADNFIKNTKNRSDKTIKAYKGTGGSVEIINVNNRYQQIDEIIKRLKSNELNGTTAILFRINESAVYVADALERAGLDYLSRNVNENILSSSRVLDSVKNYLTLSNNENDISAFNKIVYANKLYFRKDIVNKAIMFKDYYGNLLDSFVNQIEYGPQGKEYLKYKERTNKFVSVVRSLKDKTPFEMLTALNEIFFAEYCKEKNCIHQFETLIEISKKEETIDSFLDRVEYLRKTIIEHRESNANVVLSTIHSCKGKEYDNVFVIDVIEGLFPNHNDKNLPTEINFFQPDNEKRLFYVAITRAKNNLYLFNIIGKSSDYIKFAMNYATKQSNEYGIFPKFPSFIPLNAYIVKIKFEDVYELMRKMFNYNFTFVLYTDEKSWMMINPEDFFENYYYFKEECDPEKIYVIKINNDYFTIK